MPPALNMDKPNTKRFALWAILVSLGWLSFLWIQAFGVMFLSLAGIFTPILTIPREQLQRVVPRPELWWIGAVSFAFVIAIVAAKILIPAVADQAAERFLRHPAVIIPLWLACLWLGYRGWRKQTQSPG
jgi:predicted PurR-regulated permease PerM